MKIKSENKAASHSNNTSSEKSNTKKSKSESTSKKTKSSRSASTSPKNINRQDAFSDSATHPPIQGNKRPAGAEVSRLPQRELHRSLSSQSSNAKRIKQNPPHQPQYQPQYQQLYQLLYQRQHEIQNHSPDEHALSSRNEQQLSSDVHLSEEEQREFEQDVERMFRNFEQRTQELEPRPQSNAFDNLSDEEIRKYDTAFKNIENILKKVNL
jgi:hypothetical protein